MHIRMSALSLTAFALIGCDGMSNKRSADAAEANDARMSVSTAAPQVVAVQLGRHSNQMGQTGPAQRITNEVSSFNVRDTVVLAVVTSNAASDARITVRLSFQDGSVVDSSSAMVGSISSGNSTGNAETVTPFHLARDKGFSVGNYTVHIWLNNELVETRQFTIAR